MRTKKQSYPTLPDEQEMEQGNPTDTAQRVSIQARKERGRRLVRVHLSGYPPTWIFARPTETDEEARLRFATKIIRNEERKRYEYVQFKKKVSGL